MLWFEFLVDVLIIAAFLPRLESESFFLMEDSLLIEGSRVVIISCSTTNMHEVSTLEEEVIDCEGQD